MIGDILAKLGRRETLTSEEQQRVRLWGNQADLNAAFLTGIQSPEGGIVRDKINLPFDTVFSKILEKDYATIDFIVPPKYKHLLLFGQGRLTGTGGLSSSVIAATMNNDTGSNYAWGRMYHLGATLTGEQDTSDPSMRIGSWTADGDGDASNPGTFIVFFPHCQSPFYKSMIGLNAANLTTAVFSAIREGVWKSTQRIETIQLTVVPSGSFASGSVLSLYGIE
jgi:hypothetical protein